MSNQDQGKSDLGNEHDKNNTETVNEAKEKSKTNVPCPERITPNRDRLVKGLDYNEGRDRDGLKQLFKSDFDVVGFARETRKERPKRMLKEVLRFEPTRMPDNKAKRLRSGLESISVGEGFQCPRCSACCWYDDTQCRHCALKCRYMAGTGVVVLKERSDVREPVLSLKKTRKESLVKDLQTASEAKESESQLLGRTRPLPHRKMVKDSLPKRKAIFPPTQPSAFIRWNPLSFSKILAGLPHFLSLQSTSPDLSTLINLLAKRIKYFKTSAVQAAIDMDLSYITETQLFKKCLRDRALSLEFERLEKARSLEEYKLRFVFKAHRVSVSKRKTIPITKWKKFISRPLLFDGRIKRFDEKCLLDNCPLCYNRYFKDVLDVSPANKSAPSSRSSNLNIPNPRFREIPTDDEDSFNLDDSCKQRKILFDLQEARNRLLFIKRYNQGLLISTKK